jgi:hypothetical protein
VREIDNHTDLRDAVRHAKLSRVGETLEVQHAGLVVPKHRLLGRT